MNNYKYYYKKCNYVTDIRYSLFQYNETELHKTEVLLQYLLHSFQRKSKFF